MGVVHHGIAWRSSAHDCTAIRDVWRIARTGDADALSRHANDLLAPAAAHPDLLSAFGIGDPEYLASWISPRAFDPALVVVLALIPQMTLLSRDESAALAALRWTGDGGPAPATARAFRPLAAILTRIGGPVPADPRRTIGHLGFWARASTLGRYRNRGGDPRMWLVVNTLC